MRQSTGPVALALLVLPLFLLLHAMASAQNDAADFEELARRAALARASNDIPRAIELYGEAVRLNPRWPDGWWFLGSMQYGSNSYAAARDALTHYIDLTQDPTAALALRGLCEFETGEYPQSLADIQRGLSLGAANQRHNEQILRYHEALLLTRLGRFEDALQDYGYFARSGVSSPEILVGLGLAGLRTPLLPQEVKSSEQDLFLAAGGAAFQFLAGNDTNARDAFQQLFERFPTSSSTHDLYGHLMFASDPDKALAEFQRAAEIEPSNADAQAMVAWSDVMLGHAVTALPYAERAVQENPRLALAQLVLGRSLVETGEVQSGIGHLQAALQLDPANLEIHLALVRGYSEAGLKEDARRERELCLAATREEVNQVAR
jgi:tetratricopeptide (TPR) repeat protein